MSGKYGATTQNTAKTWADLLVDDNSGHMWIPAVVLSQGAPDYLVRLCHDAHVEGVGEQDDYTMWFVKQCLRHLQQELYVIEPYPPVLGVSQLKHKPPQMWRITSPGIMDYITERDARNAVMAEWLNADIHRFAFVDWAIRDIGMPTSRTPTAMFMESAMNLELHKVHTKCVEAVNDYLKLVNREGF